jgi:hypothetical protein
MKKNPDLTIASQSPVFNNFVQFQYYRTSTTNAAAASSAWPFFSYAGATGVAPAFP